MSDARRPIARLTYSVKGSSGYENYSLLSVWPTDKRGRYDISADKGSDKYPAMSIVDALKAFVSRGGRFGLTVEQGAHEAAPRPSGGGFGGGGDFGGEDIPFRQYRGGEQ